MADRKTLPAEVQNIRQEFEKIARSTRSLMLEMSQDRMVCKAGPSMAARSQDVDKVFRSVNQNLCKAHLCANALAGVRQFPKESKLAYSFTAKKSGEIILNEGEALSGISLIRGRGTTLRDLSGKMQSVERSLSDIKVTDQLVNSLDVVDFLFPILGTLTKAAAIANILDQGKKTARQARQGLEAAGEYFLKLANVLEQSSQQLKNAEGEAKKKLAEKDLQQAQTYKDRNAPRQEMKDARQALREKQAIYREIYGEESKEVADEIARLNDLLGTDPILLQPNMGNYSMNQMNYSYFTKPYGSNVGCCAVAYAIGLSIILGKPVDPTKYWSQTKGTTYYTDGHYGKSKSIDSKNPQQGLSTMYENLKKGKPVMMHYYWSNTKRSSQHWVTVVGIREGADPKNLKYEDFIVIDPGDGKQKKMSDLKKGLTKFTPSDMWVMN